MFYSEKNMIFESLVFLFMMPDLMRVIEERMTGKEPWTRLWRRVYSSPETHGCRSDLQSFATFVLIPRCLSFCDFGFSGS